MVGMQDIKDAFARMADAMDCPRCGHHGFALEWISVEESSHVNGTTLGKDKIPKLTCRGCGATLEGRGRGR